MSSPSPVSALAEVDTRLTRMSGAAEVANPNTAVEGSHKSSSVKLATCTLTDPFSMGEKEGRTYRPSAGGFKAG